MRCMRESVPPELPKISAESTMHHCLQERLISDETTRRIVAADDFDNKNINSLGSRTETVPTCFRRVRKPTDLGSSHCLSTTVCSYYAREPRLQDTHACFVRGCGARTQDWASEPAASLVVVVASLFRNWRTTCSNCTHIPSSTSAIARCGGGCCCCCDSSTVCKLVDESSSYC